MPGSHGTTMKPRNARPVTNAMPSSTPASDDDDAGGAMVQSVTTDKDGNEVSRGPQEFVKAKRISAEEFNGGD